MHAMVDRPKAARSGKWRAGMQWATVSLKVKDGHAAVINGIALQLVDRRQIYNI